MAEIDRRFALVRNGQPWYAARIADQKTGDTSFRVSIPGSTRDAHGQAQKLSDIEEVAKLVLKNGMRLRCAPEGGIANSLGLASTGVTGYHLDPGVAAKIGVPVTR